MMSDEFVDNWENLVAAWAEEYLTREHLSSDGLDSDGAPSDPGLADVSIHASDAVHVFMSLVVLVQS
jgi:hypothetical protein